MVSPLFNFLGQLNPNFQQLAAGPPALPFAIRRVGLEGGPLDRPKLFPELGSLKFRSLQARSRMTEPERAFYQSGLRLQGLGPLDLEEFLKQEHEATGVRGPRFNRIRLMPFRIRPLR